MKLTKKLFEIVSIITVIGFLALPLTGCGGDDGGTGNDGGDTGGGGGDTGGNTTVTLNSVIQNGSASQTTTQLTLTFNQAITGLSADDITLSGVTGVTKVAFSGSGPTYTLSISGFTAGGTLSVSVAKSDSAISGSPKTVTIYYYIGSNTTSSSGIDMIWIPAGTFIMGSPSTEPKRNTINETQHSVTLTKSFYMGKYQVTQAQWVAVMGAGEDRSIIEYGKGDNYPNYDVNWYDAIVFCNKLSVMEELDPVYSIGGSTDPADWGTIPTSNNATWNAAVMDRSKNGYRLPTEAEWEYACRGNYPNKATETNTKPFGIGDGTKILGSMANFDGTYPYDLAKSGEYTDSGGTYLGKTTEVGSYEANNYGLFDMHGNLYEWCWDLEELYASSATDPTGAVTGINRVLRSGTFNSNGHYLRSARRNSFNPSNRGTIPILGFRLVRS